MRFSLVTFFLISIVVKAYCQHSSSILYIEDDKESLHYKFEIDTEHLGYDFKVDAGNGYSEYSRGWLVNKGNNTYVLIDNFFKDSIPINIESHVKKELIATKYKLIDCRVFGTADDKYIRNSIFVVINDTLKVAIDSFPLFIQVESNNYNLKSKKYAITNKRFNDVLITIPLTYEETYGRNLNGDSIVIKGFNNAVWVDKKNNAQVYLRKISCDELNDKYEYLGIRCPTCLPVSLW